MVEPSGHCPHLGLKQNRAIRFASPTPEHRCYVTGEAQDIPVEQAQYCLSQGHINCPLYMGLSLPSMSPVALEPSTVPQQGLSGWFNSLLPRDKLIYSFLLGLVVVIIGIFIALSWRLFFENGGTAGVDPTTVVPAPTSVMTTPPVGFQTTTTATTSPVTMTATPSVTPTIDFRPTLSPSPIPPTFVIPFLSPTPIVNTPPMIPTNTTVLTNSTPTATIAVTPTMPTATATLSPTPPTATATLSPTPLPVVATPTDSALISTDTPAPSTPEPQLTLTPPTEVTPPGEQLPIQSPSSGEQGATTPGMPSTGEPPGTATTQQYLTLYFGDATGTLYVPVARLSAVVPQQVELAMLQELIVGPRDGLKRLVPDNVKILGVNKSRDGRTITANLDRRPSFTNDDRGLFSIALTLTELPGVRQVQFQVNGRNIGPNDGSAPIRRQAFNIDNPQKLAEEFQSGNRFLPLYFTNNGYRVRITRIYPRTTEVAQATVEELLKGAGVYSNRLERPIPADTRLLRIWKSGDRVVVDLSNEFITAADRNAALDTLILSLTELRDSQGARSFQRVEVLIEGQPLSRFWGGAYDRRFERPLLNPEGT
ncbi:MAG: GerMN domain-containing protein [Chloroflexales bacterium]|nr:GerMN domain-containing protein [Chloroflexales bacterium]